jgi:hypothetical protein
MLKGATLMKKSIFLIVVCAVFLSLVLFGIASADAFRWIRIGNVQVKIKDSGMQAENQGYPFGCYYLGGNEPGMYYPVAGGTSALYDGGFRFAFTDWTDLDGVTWPLMINDAPHGISDESSVFPTDMGDGITIKRYWRYPPPVVKVDGYILSEPFQIGDEVAPDKIPGTADVMTESIIRTRVGLEILARSLGWTQDKHDDYVIWDWTITNTGNCNLDDKIEFPNQTFNDFYLQRQVMMCPNESARRQWTSWYGCRPGDSLRIVYVYSHRDKNTTWDTFGNTQQVTGQIRGPVYAGEAVLNLSQGTGPDDKAQPMSFSTGRHNPTEIGRDAWLNATPAQWQIGYDVMRFGYNFYPGAQVTSMLIGGYPNTYYDMEPDMRGLHDLDEASGWGSKWHHNAYTAGPYTLKPGESIRWVRAFVCGSISDEMGWLLGAAWKAGNIKDKYPIDISKLPEYYPTFAKYPDVSPTENDQYKDMWVCTGKDSLFANASAAQWAFNNAYNAPIPPPPPSVTVTSMSNYINVEWSDISEQAADFAGYRVYRAIGSPEYNNILGTIVGKFTRVFECTKDNLTHTFLDKAAERGQSYFYYVTAFDDGKSNGPDWDGKVRSLESGHRINRTTMGARLIRCVWCPTPITSMRFRCSGKAKMTASCS